MSWVGLRDRKGATFSTEGVGVQASHAKQANTRLTEGTFLMEFAAIPGEVEQVLFRYEGPGLFAPVFEVRLNLDGDLIVRSEGVGYSHHYKLSAGLITRSASVVLRLTWNADLERHALSLDIAETGKVFHTALSDVEPMTLKDAVLMFVGPRPAKLGAGVRFVALADHAMPHGPLPTLASETRIQTPTCKRAVDAFKAGDIVTAADGTRAQVRWAGSVSVPALGRFAPRRICVPFHNARTDVICAQDQLMRLSGSEVEYLFATDHVLSKVGNLSRGIIAEIGERFQTVDYAQLVLDRPVALDVSGIMLEPMNLAQLFDTPSLKPYCCLADLPEVFWPLNAHQKPEVLQPFEAAAWSKLQAA